jgi:hypothetical protein
VTSTVRTISVLGGGAILVAWFVSLGVRASVGAVDQVAPRYTAMGGIPVAMPALKPLILPRRDPFAADQVHAIGPTVGGRGNIAGMQVPDPSAFGKTSAAALGVIGVIVSDHDAYALVENGAQIQVVHVNDAFAGSTVSSITQNGVVLANGTILDVDAPRPGVAPGGVATYGTPPIGASPPPAGAIPGQAPPNATVGGSGGTAPQFTYPQSAAPPPSLPYQPPASQSTNSALPGPLSTGPSGSLFPLLTPPSVYGAPHQ